IDLTRPRWREAPTQLVSAIEGYLRGSTQGQHRRDFQAGALEADRAAAALLERVRQTRGGFLRMRIMRRLIAVYRARIGLREHPKFFIVRVLDLAKRVLRREADALVEAGVLQSSEQIDWFSLAEIETIVTTRQLDRDLVEARREQFSRDAALRPPR